MYDRYVAPDTYYSHGFIVPLVTGFLIWRKSETLKKLPVNPSWSGLILIGLALLIHILSELFYVFFTSGMSILVLVFGISLFIYGKSRTRELLFPLSFLCFMFPVPVGLINRVNFPLKMSLTFTSSELVSLFGLPIYQSGFYIQTSGGMLLIDNPCSGIRSLIAFLALGSIVAYVTRTSRKNKAVLFAISLPIAYFVNLMRVIVLILVATYFGVETASPDSMVHDLSGIGIFVVGMIILLGCKGYFESRP